MAKGLYIGVDNKARKVKEMYIGVDGVARKIKKAYIGVNNVARLFYKLQNELKYYGTATALSTGACRMASANAGDYAVFSGGSTYYASGYAADVIGYNSTLTKTAATSYSIGTGNGIDYQAGASAGNYALFGGGVCIQLGCY